MTHRKSGNVATRQDIETIAEYSGIPAEKVKVILLLGDLGTNEREKLVAVIRELRADLKAIRGRLSKEKSHHAELRLKYDNLHKLYDDTFRAPHELLGVEL